ncbi:MAG: acetyl-CoA carboxylase carboxyltransferase subunit alpha [Candidatus Eutrophobiaceae bacterium]
MTPKFLEFEQPVAELEAKIEELRYLSDDKLNIAEEIQRMKQKSLQQTKQIYASLSSWQVTQVARHPSRPYTQDYIDRIITEFEELHGDRHSADDPAIICGIGKLVSRPVVIIGQQKGRNTEERVQRNYGMCVPEGYRKALRVMQLAARFGLPIVTFVDTPGAYPGVAAEEHGQSEAIATNLMEMSQLPVPIVSVVIGEGGSGGALAISVADRLHMLQYSTYSVISPEGCASILWKDAEKAAEAAEIMGITAKRLHDLGLIDGILEEPIGGAHRDYNVVARSLRDLLVRELDELCSVAPETLLQNRQEKFRNIGVFKEV